MCIRDRLLVDLDPQESAFRWAESAPLLDSDLQLDVRKMSGLELIKHVAELQKLSLIHI